MSHIQTNVSLVNARAEIKTEVNVYYIFTTQLEYPSTANSPVRLPIAEYKAGLKKEHFRSNANVVFVAG
jgi:hypothetical protein